MTITHDARPDVSYLDIQAAVGITKHMGGFQATDELLSLCHIGQAQEVLNVGCGIGVGPAYIARTYPCRVVGVDISEQMIAWSRQRAREEKVDDRAKFQVADVQDLPFESNRFDAVLVESVLAFVEDRQRALRECIRVLKPGGYVGLNEAIWLTPPPPEMVRRTRAIVGPLDVPLKETWEAIWAGSGLEERVLSCHSVEGRSEIRDRIQWVGWRWALRGFYRLARLYLSSPAARQSIKDQMSTPLKVIEYFGFMLLTGRKAASATLIDAIIR
jgi:SAM-dependent methyltransferase